MQAQDQSSHMPDQPVHASSLPELRLLEYQVIFDNAMVGIVYTIDRIIMRCNRRFEELFDYGPDELNGKSLRVLYRNDEESEAIGRVGYHLIARHGTYEDERFMVRKDGRPIWIRWYGKTLDKSDPVKGAIWICLDASRRKSAEESLHFAYEELEKRVRERTADLTRMNQELAAENEARKRSEEIARVQQSELARMSRIASMGEMATTLAHQLGQPLSATLNYLHGCLLRMESGQFDQQGITSAIQNAIRHTEQAGEIIQHVRRFVRKHEPERFQLHCLNDQLARCIEFLRFELNHKEVAIELITDERLPLVPFDRIEIEQVMMNLIKNAIESMQHLLREERKVRVASRQRGKFVYVDISDSGPGVPDDIRSRIFEPFFTTKSDGVGFGLVICASIIESHGGKLSQKNLPGQGATFTFSLPAK